MVMGIIPTRGGFQRPFGTAVFIKDFLGGRGNTYGVAVIDTEQGATQTDILAAYKMALHRALAEDRVAQEVEGRIRSGEPPLTSEEEDERLQHWLSCYPLARCRMHYQSFLVYFGFMKRLGWVEPTGRVEESLIQERMAISAPETPRETGQPRIYYRLTASGSRAASEQLKNPLMALYPQFDHAYFAERRAQRRYVRCV